MRDLWNWFDGKKTVIAAFYMAVTWPTIMIIFDNEPSDVLIKVNMIIGISLTFLGLGHKLVKKD